MNKSLFKKMIQKVKRKNKSNILKKRKEKKINLPALINKKRN